MYALKFLCFILFVNDHEPLQEQGIVIDDFVFAERNHETGETAGSNDGSRFAQLFLHMLQDAVDHAGIAVHDAAAHAVDGVFTDDTLRNVQADGRKLCRLAA